MERELKSLIDQMRFSGIEFAMRRVSQPGAELGDDPPHAIAITQSLISWPEAFE